MYTLYKFHFLNGISEINQLFDDILIIWPAPVYSELWDFFYYKFCIFSLELRVYISQFWETKNYK